MWLGNLPVAVLSPAGNFYIAPDHLGAPHQITNTTGKVAWQWDHDPFGNGTPSDPLGNFSYDLRFPGQFHDQATHLHYNYFRDYDPRLERYIESDPIGLVGGINTYAYVENNPISAVDVFGVDEDTSFQNVFYNAPPPRTIPTSPLTERQVQCMAQCLGQDLTITGGSEPGHAPVSIGGKHGCGLAVDLGSGANPDLPQDQIGKNFVNNCARLCGFTNGSWEPDWIRKPVPWKPPAPHYHFQNGAGAGVPPIPDPIPWLPMYPASD